MHRGQHATPASDGLTPQVALQMAGAQMTPKPIPSTISDGILGPMSTEFLVLRADGDLRDSDLPRSVESVGRKRTEFVDQTSVDVLGPAGNMRAYRTGRVETAPDGSVAEVYEVLHDAADLEQLRTDNIARVARGEVACEP